MTTPTLPRRSAARPFRRSASRPFRRSPSRPSRRLPARLPSLTVAALGAVLLVCLVVGLVAALVGGAASRAGSGPGGLGGVPQLLLLGLALPLGLASAVASRARPARALLVLAGPLLVAFGYFFFSHAVDPCALGVWDVGTTLGGAPACESGSYGTSLAERFHLLEHALAGGVLLVAYAAVLRRADTA